MISITRHGYSQITISGHAEYAEEGKDIVCAAVSAIAQTLARYLESVYDKVSYQCDKGYISITLLDDDYPDAVKNAIDMAFCGFDGIKEAYNKNVYISSP